MLLNSVFVCHLLLGLQPPEKKAVSQCDSLRKTKFPFPRGYQLEIALG